MPSYYFPLSVIIVFFLPTPLGHEPAENGPVKGSDRGVVAVYVLRWSKHYFFRAALQYHVHFHEQIISIQAVYQAEERCIDAPMLMASYITPNVRPPSFDPRKRPHIDSLVGSRAATAQAGSGARSGRGDGKCWNWNTGRPCLRDPCIFAHICSIEGARRRIRP